MKKLSVVLVVVLTVFAGITSATPPAGTRQVAAPCCKHIF